MAREKQPPVIPVNAGENNNRRQARRTRKRLWIGIGAGILFALLLIGLGYLVLDEMALTSFAIRDISPGKVSIPPYALTAEQTALVGQLGYPESFAIMFYEEQQADNSILDVRAETWTYYSKDKAYTFINGVKTDEQSVGKTITGIIPIPYKPEQFVKYMSLQDMVASAGLTELLDVPVEKEIVPGGEVYYGDQITFGMKDGELLYVETLTLTENE